MAEPDRWDYAALADDIADWLQAHMREAGAERLVLGLSGGIDSAVVCALCTMAAGPSRVTAAIMPINSSDGDRADAEAVARHYEVTAHLIDLAPTYDALLAALPDEHERGFAEQPVPNNVNERRRALALANIKPRLRMTTLYALANSGNGVVVGTGNKTELSIGYFTKYGDGGVDLLPIGDLDKTAVRALARELGVPSQIIARAPSAGLWQGQTDESEIGLTYEQLDRTLAALATKQSDVIAAEVRDRVGQLVQASEHKRRPVPVFRFDERSQRECSS